MSECKIDMEDVIQLIKDALEVEQINTIHDELDRYDWDSIAIIGFLSLVNEKYGITIEPREIQKAKTISDLMSLVER